MDTNNGGIWKKLFEIFKGNKKFEWLVIDSTYIKAHHYLCGARGGNQAISKTKRGLNLKIHLVVNKYCMPINFIVTGGSFINCKKAIRLIKNINTKLVSTDHAYDINDTLPYLNQRNIKPVISPKRNRLYQADYWQKLYCLSNVIENTFLALKRWRGISTRYAKTIDAFVFSVFVCGVFILF